MSVEVKQIQHLEDLKPDPRNANKGTPRGHGIIEQSIRRHGAGRSGLAARDGTMIAGNQTLEEMAALGIPVRAVHTDGSEWVVVIRDDVEPGSSEAAAMAIEDNRATEAGLAWDASTLAELAEADASIKELWDETAWSELMEAIEVPADIGGAGDEFDPTPQEGPTRTQVGDLWEIGPHRLLVGDCTDPANVERLMQGEPAAVIVTDPPYAVAYVDKARDMHQRGYGHSRAKSSAAIEGDEIDDEQAEAIWRGAFWAAKELALAEHAAWYVWHAPGRATRTMLNVMADLGMLHHQTIIWVKNNFVIGRCDYQWQHEPCWYGWQQGNRPPFYGAKNQTTIWEVGRDLNPEHPTQKPVALWEPAILNHTKPNDILYDCFAGSGPALVAAHQHGRRAYLMEKGPARADVILRRAEAANLPCVRHE